MPDPDARQRLLDAAVDHLAAHGLSDLSLRQLAAALGTSHRMLIYHFGSKEGLLVEVIRAVERRQREAFADLKLDEAVTPRDTILRMWRRFADPELAPHERLFFEVYGQALQGRAHALPLLDGIVASWLEPTVELARARGIPEDVARADARLGVAVMRGLLLDLLATGDRAGVDAAAERFAAAYEALMGAGASPAGLMDAETSPAGVVEAGASPAGVMEAETSPAGPAR